jgi:hypothetical protein
MPASCGPADSGVPVWNGRVRIVLEDQLDEPSHVLAAECGEHEKGGLERTCARTDEPDARGGPLDAERAALRRGGSSRRVISRGAFAQGTS